MKRKPDLEIGGAVDPYMRRWYIIPRNRVFCIYLHNMLRDDDDRALHDHPGANLSIVLRGGYREITFSARPREGKALPAIISKHRPPGAVVFRLAKTAHRLELLDQRGSWSLFFMGPKRREWGFWCGVLGRWVHWRLFTDGENGEIVGKGCE